MSETVRLIALLGPIAVATLVTSLIARRLATRVGLAYTLIAIAVIASLVTVVDLLVLNHFMLITPGNPTELVSVALYSVTAGVAAALIVSRSNTRALARLVATARSLGENRLDARAGELRAAPELRLLGETLDAAAARLEAGIEAERAVEAAATRPHDVALARPAHADRQPAGDGRGDRRRASSRDPETVAPLHSRDAPLGDGARDDGRRPVRARPAGRGRVRPRRPLDGARRGRAGRARPVPSRGGRQADPDRRRPRRRRASLCSPKLARVVHSLLDNAVRYTPAGGWVTLRARAGADGISLSVEDSGPGIAPGRAAARLRGVLARRPGPLEPGRRARADPRQAHRRGPRRQDRGVERPRARVALRRLGTDPGLDD